MRDFNENYTFNDWNVSCAENGYVVTTACYEMSVDGSTSKKTLTYVYKTIDSLVRNLIDHCKLLENKEKAGDFAVILCRNDLGDK